MTQTIDLGDKGLIPLEIRWQHDPDSAQGFVGATLSSNIIRFARDNGSWRGEDDRRGQRGARGLAAEGGVPGLITDLVLSLDDKDLFFSNWLHGDLRHYDVSDPRNPTLRSQVWLGGLLGGRRSPEGGRAAQRRAADAPELARRRPRVRVQLAVLDLGQPVLSGLGWLPSSTAKPTAPTHSTRTSSSTSTSKPTGPRPTRSTSLAATARRRSSSDLRPRHGSCPFEETLGSLGPALLLAAGAASARLSAHVRHLRRPRRRRDGKRTPAPVKGHRERAAGSM